MNKQPTTSDIIKEVYEKIKEDVSVIGILETQEIAQRTNGAYVRGIVADSLLNTLIQFRIEQHDFMATTYMKNQVKQALKDQSYISRELFDNSDNLLTVKNGRYFLEPIEVIAKGMHEGELKMEKVNFASFDRLRKVGFTYYTFIKYPIFYDIAAICPLIDNFLGELVGEENIYLIYMIVGYILFSTIKYQKAFIFKGLPNTGKSTFVDMLKRFIGKRNYTSVSLQDIPHRFQKANLRDKVLNIYDDLPNVSMKNIGVFKELVTGDTVGGEVKNVQGNDVWNNICKQMYTCNNLPEIKDKNIGDDFWRRIILVECNNEVKAPDRDILNKLCTKQEFSGLLNKAIHGYRNLVKNKGFGKQWDNYEYIESVWNINANPLQLFINERCEFDKKSNIMVLYFLEELNKFREQNNTKPITQKLCTTELKNKYNVKIGPKTYDVKERVYWGIIIKGGKKWENGKIEILDEF